MRRGKLFLALLLLVGCAPQEKVCFDQACFKVEVVDTYEERMKGLMFREHLDQGKGMLFVFDEPGVYPFWMKNTLIPLDIIWMDKDWRVVFISENTPPCKADPCPSYNPGEKALYVLEVNAGVAEEKGIRVGEKGTFG